MSVFIWGPALVIQTEISPERRRTVQSVILICWNIPADHNSISSHSMLTKQLWINLVSGMNIFTGKLRLVQMVVISHHSGNVWMTTWHLWSRRLWAVPSLWMNWLSPDSWPATVRTLPGPDWWWQLRYPRWGESLGHKQRGPKSLFRFLKTSPFEIFTLVILDNVHSIWVQWSMDRIHK